MTHKTEVEGHDPAHIKALSGHKTDSIFKRYRIGKLRNLVNVVYPLSANVNPEVRQEFGKFGKTG